MPPISKSGYDMGDELNPKLPNRDVLNVGWIDAQPTNISYFEGKLLIRFDEANEYSYYLPLFGF